LIPCLLTFGFPARIGSDASNALSAPANGLAGAEEESDPGIQAGSIELQGKSSVAPLDLLFGSGLTQPHLTSTLALSGEGSAGGDGGGLAGMTLTDFGGGSAIQEAEVTAELELRTLIVVLLAVGMGMGIKAEKERRATGGVASVSSPCHYLCQIS
jgi:hypothetical protein